MIWNIGERETNQIANSKCLIESLQPLQPNWVYNVSTHTFTQKYWELKESLTFRLIRTSLYWIRSLSAVTLSLDTWSWVSCHHTHGDGDHVPDTWHSGYLGPGPATCHTATRCILLTKGVHLNKVRRQCYCACVVCDRRCGRRKPGDSDLIHWRYVMCAVIWAAQRKVCV